MKEQVTQCKGITRNGEQCKNFPKKGCEYCRHHQNASSEVESQQQPEMGLPKWLQRIGVKEITLVSLVGIAVVLISLYTDVLSNIDRWLDNQQVMSGEFSIAIASFSELGVPLDETGIGQTLAKGCYQRLEDIFEEQGLGYKVTIWGPEQVGTVVGTDPLERTSNASQLANAECVNRNETPKLIN